jgi:ABC-type Na+ efflux pump permease subunit
VLTTPIRREEFIVGKMLAVLAPSIVVAYVVFGAFLAWTFLFAEPAIASAIIRPADIAAQILFTPLLACLFAWVGIGISTRSSDVRVAQQLTLLGSIPAVLVTSLIAFDVIQPSLGLAVGLAVGLFVADVVGWRVVAPMFDRERLVTGSR